MDHTITSQDFTLNITSPDDTWTMDKGVTITTDAQLGIFAQSAATNTHLIINGQITTTENANTGLQFSALVDSGDNSRVDIGKTGVLTGERGALFQGDHQIIHNSGKVTGTNDIGITIHSNDVDLTNQGTITGTKTFGLNVEGADNHVVNGVHGVITGAAGVEFDAVKDDINTLVNHGTIKATAGFEVAIFGNTDAGKESIEDIRNDGKIEGNVMLGGGDDKFDNRGGSVTGVVAGGTGDDSYIVGKQHYRIAESDNGGDDTVTAYSSYKVAAHQSIENTWLGGKANLNLTGNANAEFLHGNDGDNQIKGGGGDDFIYGGKGADILTGQGGADHFFFSTGDGHDVVSDYQDGSDVLELGLLKGITSFDDLKQNHTTEHNGDLIIHVGSDHLVIHDLDKQDFDAKDVSFHIYL
jgi:Ca2+-binding RTX toxin-like protein